MLYDMHVYKGVSYIMLSFCFVSTYQKKKKKVSVLYFLFWVWSWYSGSMINTNLLILEEYQEYAQ